MKTITTKRLCRSSIICALYVVLSYTFLPFAFGSIQLRPAEALCILPLFYVEAIPALFIGCALVNLSSPFLFYDVIFGSLTTLIASFITYLVGKYLKKDLLKLTLGGLAHVLLNALIIPFVIMLVGGENGVVYFTYALLIAIEESLCVYGLGVPFYFAIKRIKKRLQILN